MQVGTLPVYYAKDKRDLKNYVEKLLVDLGQSEPPVDLELIAKQCNIHEIVEYPKGIDDPEGVLVPVRDGFLVRIAAGLAQTRRRSTLAHEIAHTFYFDASHTTPKKRTRSFSHFWGEEGTVSEIARQILVPRSQLQPRALAWRGVNTHFSLETLLHLLETFRVSADIMIRRLQDENLCDAVFIFFKEDRAGRLVPERPMFSVGSLRIKGICGSLTRDDDVTRLVNRLSLDSSSSAESLVEVMNWKLRLVGARISAQPLRILTLATPQLNASNAFGTH